MKKKFVRLIAAVFVCCLLYSTVDLFWPFQRDLRGFDPAALGTLETSMWRSYYDRRPVKLFFELAEVLRTQYHFPLLRSFVGAFYASRAAFVFKDGKQWSDYERVLPSLNAYFSEIHRIGNIDFNIRQASNTELRWWIVHRERDKFPVDALARACAEAAATLYQVSPDSAMEHGHLRADAMVIRDTCAAAGHVGEKDWDRIENLLRACYKSLHRVINAPEQLNGGPGLKRVRGIPLPADRSESASSKAVTAQGESTLDIPGTTAGRERRSAGHSRRLPLARIS